MNEWKNRFSSLTIQMAGSILRTMKEIPLVSVDDRNIFFTAVFSQNIKTTVTLTEEKKRHRTIDLPVRSQELHSFGDADDYS